MPSAESGQARAETTRATKVSVSTRKRRRRRAYQPNILLESDPTEQSQHE